MTPRIYVTSPLPGNALELLARVGEVTVSPENRGLDAFAETWGACDALVSLLTDRIDAGLLARAPRLQVVANVAVGVDNIDLAACRARNVVVTNTPGVLTEATADFAFGLMIAAARRLGEGERLVRRGAFSGWGLTMLLGAPVHGATLGIVGLGRIGQAVARRARGFGMHVLYTQRNRLAPELERSLGATYADVDTLFRESDFVSLHCPLTPETRHLASADRLARMRPGAVLVNTARGPCVDEAALVAALENGPLAAAGLDVFEDEPRVHPGLLGLENVVLAPHVASADRPTREAMARTAADNVVAILEGRPPLTPA